MFNEVDSSLFNDSIFNRDELPRLIIIVGGDTISALRNSFTIERRINEISTARLEELNG